MPTTIYITYIAITGLTQSAKGEAVSGKSVDSNEELLTV